MPGLLGSIASSIDPSQITVRPSVPTANSSSSTDNFQSVLAQTQKNNSSEQPGPPADKASPSTAAADSRKADKASKKRSHGKHAAHRKKSDKSKDAATSTAQSKDEAGDDAADAVEGPNPPPAESDDAKALADAAAAAQLAAQNSAQPTPSATAAQAANQSAAQSAAQASIQAGAQVATQSATANQPPPPTPKSPQEPLSPAAVKVAAVPTPATKSDNPLFAKPLTNAAISPTVGVSTDGGDATDSDADSTDDSFTAATTAASATADARQAVPAQTTGLKAIKTAPTDATTQAATTAAIDQSATAGTIDALDSSGNDSESTDLPAAAVAVDPAAVGLAAASQLAGNIQPATSATSGSTAVKAAGTATLPSRPAFVAANQPAIVQSVKTDLLPNGGVMHMRLDPPELGVLQISVHVKDGVVNASFQTSNDDATKLLSHSLGELKNSLEAQGVSIGKIHVQQTPKDQAATNRDGGNSDSSKQSSEGSSSRQDEQRREALKRMWERLANGGDPLDLVA